MRDHLFGLDIVRCIAILLVLGCHCGLAYTAWFLVARPAFLGPLGYYGVELFFVLSGVLIGQILVDLMVARRPNGPDWLAFMGRRWLSTLPLYLVWLLVLARFTPLPPSSQGGTSQGGTSQGGTSLGATLLLFATFRQNLFWPQPDWFAVSWSLAIEEWFYLSFSVTLLAAVRVLGGGRGLAATLGVFLACPLALRLAQPASANWNEFLHKAVLFRLDAITFGVLAIAVLRLAKPSTRTRLALLVLGGVMIALQAAAAAGAEAERLLGPATARAFGFDVTDAGFALMLPALMRLPRPGSWLAWPVNRFAAQSYGTYITHSTILGWVGTGRGLWHWSGLTCTLGGSLVILLVPVVSWIGLERPILILRPHLRRASFGATVAGRPEAAAARMPRPARMPPGAPASGPR